MKYFFYSILFLITFNLSAQKIYKKAHYKNGNVESEGFLKENKKQGYWKFYYDNGTLKKQGHYLNDKPVKYWYFYNENGSKQSEGHYYNGSKNKWWVFYDDMGKINHKCQLKLNQKDGYCIVYEKGKIIMASKYEAGKKIKEWTSLKAFKKENNLLDLQ